VSKQSRVRSVQPCLRPTQALFSPLRRVGQDVPDPSSDLMGSLDYAWGIDASMPLDGQCTDDSDVRVISAKNRDLK
jgi:hypothetical protein